VQAPGLDICRSFNRIRFGVGRELPYRVPAPVPGIIGIPGTNHAICLELIENSETSDYSESVYNDEMGFVDWGRVSGSLELRSWMPGDRIRPMGSSGIKKFKNLFQLARIPSWERVPWPLLVDGNAIVWSRRFGPAAAVPSEIDPMVVATLEDIRVAERRLLRGLVKDTDGFMARHFDRRISLQISRRLAPTAVKPTQITMLSIAIGLCGAPFFLSAHWSWQTVGALLFLLHSIVDGCDGELARLKFQESRYGGILDFWGDNIVHVAIFGCIAAGWALSAAARWPLWLGAAAIAGTLGSAGFVHWRQLRVKDGSSPLFTSVSTTPDGRLSGLADAASRRDFIYVVPIFALFGKSSWFLLLAAIGAPIFFLLLIFLAVRERLQGRRTTATA
jgi:tRNA(Ile)-lysidine synthetase-like protein